MYAPWKDLGVQVVAIASNESRSAVENFDEQLSLDLPVLYDGDGRVWGMYQEAGAFTTAPYPQEWLIGTDGVVVYYANELEIDAVTAAIAAELAGG